MQLSGFLDPRIRKDYAGDFSELKLQENAGKTVGIGFLSISFCTLLLVLDYFRYQDGNFEDLYYRLLFVNHLLLGLMGIPGLIIFLNRKRVKHGTYKYTRVLLRIFITQVVLTILPLGVFAWLARGTYVPYAVYVILVNLILYLPFRLRLVLNLLGLAAMVLCAFVKFEHGPTIFLGIVDMLGITVPIFYISTIQLEYKYKNFLAEKLLAEQKKIIEKEKENSEILLLNILPKAIAHELMENGVVESKLYEEATIMFLDFKNFTLKSKDLSPIRLVDELNIYFKAFDEIIKLYGIEKIKTIGDAYMCVAGVPKENSEQAVEMITAAKEILAFIEQRKSANEKNGELFFEARIGIHTGPVVAGVVGTLKFAYDIWGDAVNLASRIEQASQAGLITISESTYVLVENKMLCTHLGRFPVKGSGEVELYSV